MGAATVEELVDRYRRAHQKKDMEDLRGILLWESQLSHHRLPLEKPISELFEMPLDKAKYIAGPPLPYKRGGDATYIRPNGTTHSMSGPICGKILLVEKANPNQELREFDPSYIVVQFHEFDGRYYIDVLQDVAEDAARAFKTNSPQKFIPKPLEAINNPYRKKK